MAVPNTTTFSMQDVADFIDPPTSTPTISQLIADANATTPSQWDSEYSGSKDSLLNFRNYGNTPIPIPTNPSYALSSMTAGSEKYLSFSGFPPYTSLIGGFVSNDGRHGIIVGFNGNRYYFGYYSYNIAFQSDTIYYNNTSASIVGYVQVNASTVCSMSKDQQRIQVLGMNAAGYQMCETIYLSNNYPSFGTPLSVAQTQIATLSNTNYSRNASYVSQMSDNLFGYVAINNSYKKQLFIGRGLYTESTIATANFGSYSNGFNALGGSFMDNTNQGTYNPIATLGGEDEYVLIYDNTSNSDRLYMYEISPLPLNSLDDSTEQSLSFGNFGGNVANMNVPNVNKLILYQTTSQGIQITDKNTNF
tara:strand:+ start:180 stop:1265 length:1086 start_codon:yes stop_codon:yes gene_type:complete